MDTKRRKFLKIAGAAALAGIGAPALIKLTSTLGFCLTKSQAH